MQEPSIEPRDLHTWAEYLLSHSLGGVGREDRVMVKGERICWPLMEVLESKIIQAGAVPDVYLIPPNNDRGRVWSAGMGRAGTGEQLQAIPAWHRARYESMTKYIEVLGAEDPDRFVALSADQSAALAKADREFADLRVSKPWVLTLFPTPGFCAMEGMDLPSYAAFIVKASTTDPRPLKESEERLSPLLDRGERIEIVTRRPGEERELVLTMAIASSQPVLSYGLRNFPDGEVFTSPDARSPEGEIYLDLPIHHSGHTIQGIYLELRGGKITAYEADQGQEQLAAIVETDAGSHRLGEVAFGMNPGLTKVLKHPLFVEKVGGTLHIAIGQSYENCFVSAPGSDDGRAQLLALEKEGILNRSAHHVDIVCDFRGGGAGQRVTIDGRELIVQDNVWVPGEA